MKKCLFCNKTIDPNRKKYCSTQCIKRAWYLKNNPNVRMYRANNPKFWETETGIGLKWEQFAAKLLKAKLLLFNMKGADLDWNGKMVDVKVCNLYKRKFKRGKPVKSNQAGVWVFNRNKEKLVDFFFCIALLKNKPHKLLLIPGDEFPKKGLVIGHKSTYDKFSWKVSSYSPV